MAIMPGQSIPVDNVTGGTPTTSSPHHAYQEAGRIAAANRAFELEKKRKMEAEAAKANVRADFDFDRYDLSELLERKTPDGDYVIDQEFMAELRPHEAKQLYDIVNKTPAYRETLWSRGEEYDNPLTTLSHMALGGMHRARARKQAGVQGMGFVEEMLLSLSNPIVEFLLDVGFTVDAIKEGRPGMAALGFGMILLPATGPARAYFKKEVAAEVAKAVASGGKVDFDLITETALGETLRANPGAIPEYKAQLAKALADPAVDTAQRGALQESVRVVDEIEEGLKGLPARDRTADFVGTSYAVPPAPQMRVLDDYLAEVDSRFITRTAQPGSAVFKKVDGAERGALPAKTGAQPGQEGWVEFADRGPAEGVVRTGSNKNREMFDEHGRNLLQYSQETLEEFHQRMPVFSPEVLRAQKALTEAGIDPNAYFRKMKQFHADSGALPRGAATPAAPARSAKEITTPSKASSVKKQTPEERWGAPGPYATSARGVKEPTFEEGWMDAFAGAAREAPPVVRKKPLTPAEAALEKQGRTRQLENMAKFDAKKKKERFRQWRNEFDKLSDPEKEVWLKAYDAKYGTPKLKKRGLKGFLPWKGRKAKKEALQKQLDSAVKGPVESTAKPGKKAQAADATPEVSEATASAAYQMDLGRVIAPKRHAEKTKKEAPKKKKKESYDERERRMEDEDAQQNWDVDDDY